LEKAERFDALVQPLLARVAEISKRLRKEREFSFYGDEAFIPTEEYDRSSAEGAVADARWVFDVAERVIQPK
jgi:hypothetical protein